MTVAFDTFASTFLLSSGGTFNVTPTGTPRAVLAFLTKPGVDAPDLITGCTYGGVALSELPPSPLEKATGEPGTCWAYFLGSGIASGLQAFAITGTGASSIGVYVLVLTAADDTEVVATSILSSDSIANPSTTLALSGRDCFVAEGFFSGVNFSFQLLPFANWNYRLGTSLGGSSSGCMTYDIVANADVTVGWTQAADDAVSIAAAVSEIQTGSPGAMLLFGVE